MKIFIFIFMFLMIGSLVIINNNDLNIYETEDSKEFSKVFFSWVDSVYKNVQNITGKVVKSNWIPG
jgi:hypothetical protein